MEVDVDALIRRMQESNDMYMKAHRYYKQMGNTPLLCKLNHENIRYLYNVFFSENKKNRDNVSVFLLSMIIIFSPEKLVDKKMNRTLLKGLVSMLRVKRCDIAHRCVDIVFKYKTYRVFHDHVKKTVNEFIVLLEKR